MTDIKKQNHGAALSIAMELVKYKVSADVTVESVIEDTKKIYAYLAEVSQDVKEFDK